MQFVVVRRACLPEDEGRDHIDHIEPTLESAMKWVAAQEKEYFKPSDYSIVEVPDALS